MATILANKSAFVTKAPAAPKRAARAAVVVRAQKESAEVQGRRATLASIAGAAASLAAAPAFAAYGDSANVFGKATNTTGFVPYAGEGFALLLPARWNPSREQDFPGTLLRYEDNGDAVNNFVVIANPTDKGKISDFGDKNAFLNSVSYLLGKQSFSGDTVSEGGFQRGRVSAASVLDIGSFTDKKGREYYTYELLTRTADGNEGGRHQLVKATVADGKLWILLVRVGDKRWFKGAKKDAVGVFDSFIVA
uniref:PsbP C-terminal domain-containing protein n=1 Tax=Chlamydomonas euryale TaxID=1486919 RepID=A0A7R9V3H8_9CHLO